MGQSFYTAQRRVVTACAKVFASSVRLPAKHESMNHWLSTSMRLNLNSHSVVYEKAAPVWNKTDAKLIVTVKNNDELRKQMTRLLGKFSLCLRFRLENNSLAELRKELIDLSTRAKIQKRPFFDTCISTGSGYFNCKSTVCLCFLSA